MLQRFLGKDAGMQAADGHLHAGSAESIGDGVRFKDLRGKCADGYQVAGVKR